jgi:hypothetical protein
MSTKEGGKDKDSEEKFNDLMTKMKEEKKKWDEEDNDSDDETDALLNKAIEVAISQGKGWKDGEREAYLEKILDDDYLDPLFATTEEELAKTGMADAFSSLLIDDPPARLMAECKKKGNDSFLSGKKNVAKNVQVRRRDPKNTYAHYPIHVREYIKNIFVAHTVFTLISIFSTIAMQLIIIMNHFIGLKK